MNKFWVDLAERMARAFVAAAAGVVAAGAAGVTNVDAVRVLVVGAVAAGVSAAMSVVASKFGDPDTASFRKGA
jgi:hypothetical protein